jgi:hypothetical protein
MNETTQMNDSFGPLPTPPSFKFNRMEDSVVGGPLTLDRACKELSQHTFLLINWHTNRLKK